MPAECPNEGVENSLGVTLKTEPSGNAHAFAQSHSQLLGASWKAQTRFLTQENVSIFLFLSSC